MAVILLTLLALGSAAIHIRAEYYGPRRHVYVFKPLTMVLIVLVALQAAEPVSSFYKAVILIALLFSMAGDIFLMLPTDRFVQGLVSFLIAHLFYIVAFAGESDYTVLAWTAIPLLVVGGVMLWLLWPTLGEMKPPVMVYMLVILAMGWQAINRWLETDQTGSGLAAFGALLFIASDSLLALNRFRKPFRASRLLVLSTYFSAQWLIALSVQGG
jgi:uncharacterized membrane protein YhhN